jgi:molecular chaperone GrpE
MSRERRHASAGEGDDARVKVTDRRRFSAEGEPLDEAASSEAPPGPAAAETAAPASPDERDRRLAEQAARIDELSRAYAALVEDNKGFRQRQERERVRVIEAERAGVAQALLEAADDLERALAAASGAVKDGGEGARALLEGVRLSLGALHKRIADIGAERLSLEGQPFDPHLAEAVDAVPVSSEDQDGIVLQEVRPGWRIGDRMLRPARVRVGRIARA